MRDWMCLYVLVDCTELEVGKIWIIDVYTDDNELIDRLLANVHVWEILTMEKISRNVKVSYFVACYRKYTKMFN